MNMLLYVNKQSKKVGDNLNAINWETARTTMAALRLNRGRSNFQKEFSLSPSLSRFFHNSVPTLSHRVEVNEIAQ